MNKASDHQRDPGTALSDPILAGHQSRYTCICPVRFRGILPHGSVEGMEADSVPGIRTLSAAGQSRLAARAVTSSNEISF